MTMSGQPIELAETAGSLADQVTDNILSARKVPSNRHVIGTTVLFRRHAWSGHRLVYPAGLLTPEFRLDLAAPRFLSQRVEHLIKHIQPRGGGPTGRGHPFPQGGRRIFALHHLPGPRGR